MTQDLRKKLFIVVTVLLVISIIFGGSLWYHLNTKLNNIAVQLTEHEQMLSGYANLKKQIDLRLGIEQDGQHFITPDDPEISAKVQEITGGYSEDAKEFWKDYGHLFWWVVGNIAYGADGLTPQLPESINGTLGWRDDFWKLPAETMRDGAGDCEDMSVLLTSMLLNYTQRRFTVWVVGIRTFDPTPKAHIAVAIPLENYQLAIFDPTSRYYTPFPSIGGIGSQLVSRAIDDWLTRLGKEMAGAQIYVVFSENFYQEFSTTEEFIDWAYGL